MSVTVEVTGADESAESGAEQPFEARLEACALGEAELPREVLIAPWGEVASANGSFVVDAESAAVVVSAFATHGTDLPIDYEHQSLGGAYASPSGLAPAAGWIRAMSVVRPGEESAIRNAAGLWAQVEWTDSGRERLAAREYRYLSPVVLVRKSDRRVVALHSAALTNKPAIVGMRPIVNREDPDGEARDRGALSSSGEGLVRLVEQLGLPKETEAEAVLVAASERLAGLARERAERDAADRVAQAARAGKIPAGLREWAMRLAMSAPACFDEWVAAAPVMVVTGRTVPPNAKAAGRDHASVIASARASYRSVPALSHLTSEEAWVADALREAGMKVES